MFAGGSADEKDISSLDTPAGLIGNGYEWWLNIDQADDTYTVDKPAGEPAPDGGGDIAGTISAGLTLGMVTAYGTISQALSAVQSIGSVWALGDIDGSITSGTGALNVNSWGSISGNLNAAGNIAVSAFKSILGSMGSLGAIAATAWDSIDGTAEAKYNIVLWALSDIMSSSVISQFGEVAFTAFGSITGVTSQGQMCFVHFAGNIQGCTFTYNAGNLSQSNSFAPGIALIYVWGSMTDTTIDVSHMGSADGPVNPFGYVSVIAGGNITGSTIKASVGVDVLANGTATGDTIDTMAGASIQAALQQASGFANWLAGDITIWSLLGPNGKYQLALKLFGALVDGLAGQVGYVNLLAEKGANATINSPSWIQAASLNVSGNYTANAVDIDAWNGASLGNVEGHDAVDVFVHGTLSGSIDSDNGNVSIEASGDVSGTISGKWSAAVKTLGGCSATVSSASGPVAIDAFGAVSGAIDGTAYAEVTSDTGQVSGEIDTAGYAKIVAGGGSSSDVAAGGNVVIVSLGNVSGTIAAGDGSYVLQPGDPANIQQTWSADIDAEGNAGGTITAPGEISIEANGNISSQVTSQYSTVELDAAGQVSSSEVQGAGDVTLLGAEGINVGTITSQNGALYARSGNELILSDGNAATTATVISGGEGTATVAMSNSAGTVTITGLGNVTATVNGVCATANISAGGTATANVQGSNGGPAAGTVNVVSMGSMSGNIQQAGNINLTGWGGVNVTAQALSTIAVVSGAGLQGSYTSGGSLSVEAQGAVSGSYSAADGGVSVVGKTSVNGQITDTTTGNATVASLGTVGASVTTTAGDVSVNSGGSVTGAIDSGDDATIAALNGAISGTVDADNNAALTAQQGVTSSVEAGQSVTLVSFGAVSSGITATAGSATLNVYGTLSGAVEAGTNASVYADQAQGSIKAGGDATVTSKNTIASSVQAGGNANVSSVQGVQGNIQATGSATVLGIQNVSGNVTTTNGGVTINCGGALSSKVQAGGDASIVSLGDISGNITAGGSATVTGWSGVDGDVTATKGGATLYVNGELNGATSAGTAATATVVGDVIGNITASGTVTVNAGGQQEGSIGAGGDVSVTSGGQCSGAINTSGGASVESLGEITSPVIAGGDISLDTWTDINTGTVQAGGSATLSSDGDLQATVTAATGTIDLETLGTTQATATAQDDVTLDSLGAVNQTSLTSRGGSVDVETSDDATITVQAGQDASLLVNGNLNGTVTATSGDIDVQSLGTLTGTYTAGGDAEIDALDDISSATVSAAGNADVSTFGEASGVNVSGVLSATAWSGDAFSGSDTSTQGDVDVSALGDMTVTADAGGDATVEGMGNVQANVTSGGDSFVAALGNLSGPIRATGDAGLFAGGTLVADITGAYDATLESIGDMTGTATSSHDLAAAAYGNLNPTNFAAGQDVTLLWARGDITGTISAAGSIDQVESYGSINASLTAPTIATVSAFGPISGSFNASTSVGSVASGGSITATMNSPSVGAVSQLQLGLLADWPETPDLSDTAEVEQLNEDRAQLEQLAAQLTAEKNAALAEWPADMAAATPTYAVSIGDMAAAAAWFQNTGIQMAAQIALAQIADQQSITAAQAALQTFFASEDVRLALAKLANQGYFDSLGTWLAQEVADREAEAAADEQLGKDIVLAAQSDRTAQLAKLDYTRDNVWPIMFEKQLVSMMLDRLQMVLDIAGVFDPSILADGINTLISLARGNLLDAGINAVSMIPYAGDLAKLGKAGDKLGKFADDGLAALRRVSGDALNLMARGAGFANSCEAAARFGLDAKRLGLSRIIGCFVGDTQAGGLVRVRIGDPILVQASSVEFETDGDSRRRLFTCIMVTMAAGGWLAANRRLRKKDEREAQLRGALDLMFQREDDGDLRCDGEPLEILARRGCVSHSEGAISRAHADVMKSLALDDSPNVAGILHMPSPLAGGLSKNFGWATESRMVHKTSSRRVSVGWGNRACERGHTRVGNRRRNRFGFTWVIACLSIAAFSFFSVPSRPVKRAAPVIATAAPAPVNEEPRYELRMKPIQDYRLGERFIAINPLGAEGESEPDPATWKSVDLRLRKPSGKYLTMGLLLSPEKMEQYGIGRSPSVELDLPEMGLSGPADVLSIGPCAEIEPGEGSVVTGVFEHESEGNLVNVFFEGKSEPIGVTDNHPFLSLDRGDYVSARELCRGELLSSGYEGVIARVAYVERRPADEMLYNLQVNGHHVYHVGPLGVLVHNACPALARRLGLEGEAAAGITGAKRAIESITGTASRRFPDAITTTTIIEVKNVKRIGFTNQLRDYLYQALADGKRLVLKVRMSTEIDAELLRLEAAGFIEIIRLPALP